MKPFIFCAFPLLSCVLPGAVAGAQDAPARPANVLNVLVAPSTAATPTENLLALAKSADINLLADVDDAGAANPPTGAGTERTLFAALKAMTDAHNWTSRQTSEQTFLLWKQPDFVALAREIRDAEAAREAADLANLQANATAPTVTELPEPINVALTRYFATPAARLEANNPAAWREVSLLELPPELRQRIMESVSATQREDLQFAASSAVLGDEFWKTAVLKLRELNVRAPRSQSATEKRTPAEMLAEAEAGKNLQPYLFVAGEFKRDGRSARTMLSLGRWTPEKTAP